MKRPKEEQPLAASSPRGRLASPAEAKKADERQWLRATDPWVMYDFLQPASDSKLRLFAVACCRRVWHLLGDLRSRHAIETTERFVEGGVQKDKLELAFAAAIAAREASLSAGDPFLFAADAAAQTAKGWEDAWATAQDVVWAVQGGFAPRGSADARAGAKEARQQAALLRDLFGPLPFRPVPLDPSLRTWNDGLVVKLAEAAYDVRQLPHGTLENARLAILADALEEAGADDEILAHCRQQGQVHVRGCWVMDAILAKEVSA
jgi:hypothetical protein